MQPLKYYQVTIRYMIQQKTPTGKPTVKSKREQYLINAKSITSAQATISAVLGGMFTGFQIIGVRQSIIVGVLNQIEDVLKK